MTDLDLKSNRHEKLLLRLLLVAASLAMSAAPFGCGGGTSAPSLSESVVTHFGYTDSPLLATVIPSKSMVVLDAYSGMTIHRLVPSLASSLPVAPFPAFPIHTFRLWDVVNWTLLEPAAGFKYLPQYRDWKNNVRGLPGEITVDRMPVIVEN